MHFVPDLSLFSRKALPVLLQAEANECGVACLAMILSYWGRSTTVREVSESANLSSRGLSARAISKIAETNGLQTRAIKVALEELRYLSLPAILHWDMNHFVVLKHIAGNVATIHDPAIGEMTVSPSTLNEKFTGIALEFSPLASFEKKHRSDRWSLIQTVAEIRNLPSRLAHVFLISLLVQAIGLLSPYYVQWVLDDVLAGSDRELMKILGIGFLLLTLLQLSFGVARAWLTIRLSNELNFQWGLGFVSKLFEMPIRYFERRHVADILSRYSSLVTIQKMLTTQLVDGFLDFILVLGAAGIMLLYHPELFAISCVSISIYVTVKISLFKSFKTISNDQITTRARQQAHLFESIRSMQSIKIFGKGYARRDLWLNLLVDEVNAEVKASRLLLLVQNLSAGIFSVERIIVIWLSALMALDGKFTAGMMIAFLGYREMLATRVAALVDRIFEFRALIVHVDRVRDVFDHETDPNSGEPIAQMDQSRELAQVQECPLIEFRDVSFRHSNSDPYVFKSVSFSINARECIVIVGASGSGKSTLVKLLLGLYLPTSGEIYFKGRLLNSTSVSDVRDSFGAVMQDDLLFSGTVAENITFSENSAEIEKVIDAASNAMIHKEICEMTMGYNTIVSDGGVGLSGGQRQRILIARALYKEPELILFDEATSQLDTWNEKLISKMLEKRGITRIFVAHRPETRALADRVIEVTRDGEVKEAPKTKAAA